MTINIFKFFEITHLFSLLHLFTLLKNNFILQPPTSPLLMECDKKYFGNNLRTLHSINKSCEKKKESEKLAAMLLQLTENKCYFLMLDLAE